MRNLVYLLTLIIPIAIASSCKNSEEKISEENTTEDKFEEVISGENTGNSGSEKLEEREADSVAGEIPNQISPDQYLYTTEGGLAAVQVRVGDVDNLGFGWDPGFDPFCGENTSVHDYPWKVDSTDYEGTDRIMVVSAYRRARNDGYTSSTLRKHTDPIAIKINFEPPEIEIKELVLQMMLDDFQAPVWGSSFQFHINDKRLVYVESIINNLNQTGPTGKLVQVGILPEDFELFESGSISIGIDDPINDAGDGFAIDFVQILINPTAEYKCHGRISGVVKDEQGKTIEGVLVSANGLVQSLTEGDGTFVLDEVPVGMISVIANKSGYQAVSKNFELRREESHQITLILKKKEAEDESFLSEEINEKGFVNLYGILFDSGKDIPREESDPVLQELANFVKNNDDLSIEIIGHTDSVGDFAYNEDLSRRRAQAVKQWLADHDIDVSNVMAQGRGESNPIASNDTDEGKALNRRVEVRVSN